MELIPSQALVELVKEAEVDHSTRVIADEVVTEEDNQQEHSEGSELELEDMMNITAHKDLAQASMHHYRIKKRESTAVLVFEGSAVHSLFNILLTHVLDLPVSQHQAPVVLLAPYAFENAGCQKCQLVQKS